ncbi:aminoacyl-tRNA hydrolase [Candidatus Saccharibacteria bacterium]|nr:aminoacyl-tRNA hydrolase [Candidatus Saccharibacteria bacterium]
MALFQRRPDAGYAARYYTIGQNKQVLIIGLGNPGPEYEGTRHNVGFAALDAFVAATDLGPWIHKKDLKCDMATGRLGETQVIAIKPTTFMNLSGEAAQAVAHFYKIPAERIVAVYDELDIDFGQIRLRTGGSSAGHNGVKSLIQHLGEDFGRVRIGIGPKTPEQMDSADFVLAKFSSEQQKQLKNLTRETTAILSEYCFSDGQLPTETRSFIV